MIIPENISNPAKRALKGAGIANLRQLSSYSEKEIAHLHGIGPNALEKLKKAMKEAGLKFKTK